MVAVTGSLAVDNVEPGGDIDYLVVTQPGRLWVCRLFVVAVVRLAARRGHTLCPNYFLAENALAIHDRSLYAARELAQMAPLTAFEVYDRMRRLNAWTAEYLPNAAGLPDRDLTRHATNGRFLQKFSGKRPACAAGRVA
ncbi:MAG: hypothetical protein M5R40_17505 [Anaerolineae bacterium]|nr:hypothetical protein [Anaerolineae bacterium]